MNQMDCEEMLGALDAYLDGELDVLTTLRIESHLATCSSCTATLAKKRELRAQIQTSATYFEAPKGFEKRILKSLSPEPSRPAWLPGWGLQLTVGAGAFALGLLVAFFVMNRTTTDAALTDSIVTSHARGLLPGHLIDVASSDKHTVKPWFAGKIDYSFDVSDYAAQGFPLLGGRLDYLDHRQVAALIYGHGKHLIDLYVAPRSDLPAISKREVRGYRILSWTTSALRYIAISDMDEIEMGKFEAIFAQ